LDETAITIVISNEPNDMDDQPAEAKLVAAASGGLRRTSASIRGAVADLVVSASSIGDAG
jgi:hypothetical protein